MQLIKSDINIDFIGKRKIGFAISLFLILASLVALIVQKGPNYGIDFVGGTIIQIKFSDSVPISKIRAGLAEIGLTDASVQNFGKDTDHQFLIRTSNSETSGDGLAAAIAETVKGSTGIEPDIRRVEMVGPQVGNDLKNKALLAIFYSLLFITIYISGRFELKWGLSAVTAGSLMAVVYFLSIFNLSMMWLIAAALIVTLVLFWVLQLKYAMGAIVALIHDVLITVGIFAALDLDFSLQIIAALLTIIGYSLNDTIIVFDRIRENIKGVKTTDVLPELFNQSINGTLSRTLLTSFTTLIVLLALFFFGGEIIHNFAFAMIVGIVIGTYSSIFVASPIVLAVSKR
ncbi:MAG: protein translocase subunit SecF [Proteobacteria bacterium]|nr:protein translocase subunit SecF [Pseudomonadota bacterium]MBU1389853.1 protein translocase subunit SecF [Pseudomonadota bacterium]MBU1543862.1 protein translocase subunit SecF [Pseudomonadota bacterium]MBU2431602.1 protein translocase subunit SecF [Pseudomonadota bacterium]MBU2481101.1 protein translocase subunit SecF [Pseudomonadota bacterium]